MRVKKIVSSLQLLSNGGVAIVRTEQLVKDNPESFASSQHCRIAHNSASKIYAESSPPPFPGNFDVRRLIQCDACSRLALCVDEVRS